MPVFRKNKLRWFVQVASEPPAEPGPADYYVAPAGVASGSGVGSYMDPYDWEQAFAQTGSGLVFEYRDGSYEAPNTNIDRFPTHLPQPGLLGSPNVHRAQYRAPLTAEALWSKWRLSVGTGPVCGMANYVTFDGFDIAHAGTHTITSEGSAIALWNVLGVKIAYCRFEALIQAPGSENWGAIYGENVTGVEIVDCDFSGFIGTGSNNNATILFYDSVQYEIHHCAFSSCTSAFWPKGVHAGEPDLIPGSLHHCVMTNVTKPWVGGATAQETTGGTDYYDFYQNLCINSLQLEAKVAGRNVRVVNNTFIGFSSLEGALYNDADSAPTAANSAWDNSFVRNNLFIDPASGTLVFDYTAGATLTDLAASIDWDRNLYRGVTDYYKGATWATWTAAGMDAAGIEGDPLFTNEVGGDYTLGVGSPALGSGIDVLNLLDGGTSGAINMGCYVLPDQSDVLGVRAA